MISNGKWTRIEDVFRIENGGYSFTRVYLNLNKTTSWELTSVNFQDAVPANAGSMTPLSQPGDDFLQGGRGGWRWGYLWPVFVFVFVVVVVFFWGGRFWEGSDSDLPFLELDGNLLKDLLMDKTPAPTYPTHATPRNHELCLCFSTFLQPDHRLLSIPLILPIQFLIASLLRRRHHQLPDPLRRPKGCMKTCQAQSQQITLVFSISGIHIGIPKWKHMPLTPLCGMFFSFNSSLDSDNHCKDTINHRAIGLISIPSSFEIANKNQVYHPEYLDPASCAILFLLGLASCGITKWAPTSHK